MDGASLRSASLACGRSQGVTGVQELAVTAIGSDQPGIVAAVAGVLRDRGANVEDSAMTILGGHFAIVMLVESDDDPEDLRAALTEATDGLGLTIHVSRAGHEPIPSEPTHLLSVYGSDKPGILAGVTRALADAGANVTDLETRLLSAEDDPIYAMVIEVFVDEDHEDALTAAVSAACEDLAVDHSMRRIEAETY
jgi:glycine cleavage system transcriptional repressor